MEEGEKNFMMREVEKFQKALGGVLPKEEEIVLFDERLSSFEAQDVFKDLREKGIEVENLLSQTSLHPDKMGFKSGFDF